MPHADSSLVPESIKTKSDFWDHVYTQLEALLDDQRNWITNLANTASLIYHSLLAFPEHFGADDSKAVNWCGFYIHSRFFPSQATAGNVFNGGRLLLAPFCGKPACQFIDVTQDQARGVCANAFLEARTLVVPDVEQYPGHIACDGDTRSEIVCPLIIRGDAGDSVIGVLDLDCLAVNGFDDEDLKGLERISALVVRSCDW
ncbi:GAF domain-like protein [Infundibulicybe gibba]|nr:GAF domain-like protein [Infundibulicybe gibba]